MYREEKVMFDQIMRGKRKEERQERRLGGRFSVFFVVLMKRVLCVAVLAVILTGIVVCGSAAAFETAKEEKIQLTLAEDGYYEIDSASDFYLFWEEVCADDEYAKGRLMKDICLNKISDDMGWEEWEDLRLYRGVEVFSGVFDGNGHAVYGLYNDRGYGLVIRNMGEIRNLSISNSVICGWLFMGGICRGNYGIISECTFAGKLYATEASGRYLSGICSWNKGTIERCGFSGTVAVDGEYFDGTVSGICAENQGEIVRCYNLVDLNKAAMQSGQSRCFPVITDQGEKQCFALKDSGWDFPESGQTAALSLQQAEDIPPLIHGNFYGLLVKNKKPGEREELQNILNDEVILDLIMELITTKGENWSSLSLEAEILEESALLTLSDGEDEVTISFCPVWQEAEISENFEELWRQCAEALGEKETESFEHTSWQMVDGQEGEEAVIGYFVRFRTDEGRCGFFLQKNQKLYRIESGKNQAEASEMYETMLRELWDGRMPSVGVSWKSEEIRDAVLAELEAVREKEWETAPSREELYALESLHINEFHQISSLEDLSKIPHLKTLCFSGEGSASFPVSDNVFSYINFDLEKGMLSELEELQIDGVELVNLDFLRQFPQLKKLILYGCDINDISGLQYQKELVQVSLDRNNIGDIDPLRDCKKLESVSLRNNHVKDIYPISLLPRLREIDISDNEIITIELLGEVTKLNSLECSGNKIKDIYTLRYLQELQYLDICNNQVEDFEPITGLTGLRYLNISANPGQNIGDLIFLPQLVLGNGIYFEQDEEQEQQEAQTILELFYPQEELIAQDMVKGDLNGDGITDIVVAGLCEESQETVLDDSRKIYIFLGSADSTFQSITPIDTFGPGDGGVYGDPYNGMLITDGRLVVQVDSGSNWRSNYTWIYEYEKGKMQEKWELELAYHVHEPGLEYLVTDKENQRVWYYVIAEDRLFLLDEDNGEIFTVERDYLEKYTQFQKDIGLNLPEIDDFVYQPQIEDMYYDYQIHDVLYETNRNPREVISEAAKEFMSEYWKFPIPCYSSEEILHNYEILTGVELPEIFFIGRDKEDSEKIEILTYKSYQQNEDGSFEHKLSLYQMWYSDEEPEVWDWERNIYYDERDGIFSVG